MSDEETVAEYLRTRDPELFRSLVERHQQRVLRVVASVLGPFADLDAQEIAQEVFLRVHDALGSFRGESRFSTWVHRMAYNRALERRRRARLRFPHVPVDAAGAAPGDPFDEVAGLERRRVVARLVQRLPHAYRTVIHMHYWLGMSVDEIAEEVGMPAGTVKSSLFRARERLREYARAAGLDRLE